MIRQEVIFTYAVAYVVIPTEFVSLQAILDESLEPFQRGAPSAFPRHELGFDDATEDLRRLHRLPIQLNSNGVGAGILSTDTALATYIDFETIRALLASMGTSSWVGRTWRKECKEARESHRLEDPRGVGGSVRVEIRLGAPFLRDLRDLGSRKARDGVDAHVGDSPREARPVAFVGIWAARIDLARGRFAASYHRRCSNRDSTPHFSIRSLRRAESKSSRLLLEFLWICFPLQ